jgi:hypothetical protein
VSDTLDKFEEPDSAIMIAVVDGQVHMAYSKDLADDFDNILDILETAAIMVVNAQQKQSETSVH